MNLNKTKETKTETSAKELFDLAESRGFRLEGWQVFPNQYDPSRMIVFVDIDFNPHG